MTKMGPGARKNFRMMIISATSFACAMLMNLPETASSVATWPEAQRVVEWFKEPFGRAMAVVSWLLTVVFYVATLLSERSSGHKNSRHRESGIRSTPLITTDAVFDFLELLLPSRVMREDAGDAREIIVRLCETHGPRWKIYLKMLSSVLWILLSAAKEVFGVRQKRSN